MHNFKTASKVRREENDNIHLSYQFREELGAAFTSLHQGTARRPPATVVRSALQHYSFKPRPLELLADGRKQGWWRYLLKHG